MIVSDQQIGPRASHQVLSNRTFGLLLGVVSGVIGTWPALWGHPARVPWLLLSLGFLTFASFFSRLLYWPKIGWMAITSRIAKVVAFVLLTILFAFVIVPVALVFRIIGRDAMRRTLEPTLESYWVRHSDSLGSSDLRKLY